MATKKSIDRQLPDRLAKLPRLAFTPRQAPSAAVETSVDKAWGIRSSTSLVDEFVRRGRDLKR